MKSYMKNIGVLLVVWFIFSGSAWSQHHLGVRGGYSGGTARFDPGEETRMLFGWPSGGISWKYYSSQRVAGGIQADLQVVKKGYRMLLNPEVVDEQVVYRDFYERTLNAVELPFMWQPHLYAFDRKVRFYMNLGIYLAYIYDSYEKSGVIEGNVVTSEGKYSLRSTRDNQFEYGLCGGFGVSYLFGRIETFLEARYSFGYSDILKAKDKYPGNKYRRSPVDMLNFSMGFYYRLGKGGILAPPAQKDRIKMGGWDDLPAGPPNRNKGGIEQGAQNEQQGEESGRTPSQRQSQGQRSLNGPQQLSDPGRR